MKMVPEVQNNSLKIFIYRILKMCKMHFLKGFRSSSTTDPISVSSLQPTADFILERINVGHQSKLLYVR